MKQEMSQFMAKAEEAEEAEQARTRQGRQAEAAAGAEKPGQRAHGQTGRLSAAELAAENEQVARAARGDQQAYAALLVRYQPLLLGAIRDQHYRALGEEAQEVVQLYFADALRDFDSERGVPFAAYVRRHIYGGLATQLAAKQRRSERELHPDGWTQERGAAEADSEEGSVWDAVCLAAKGQEGSASARLAGLGSGEDAYGQIEWRESLRAGFRRLGALERKILFNTYFEEKTAKDTAALLGISPGYLSRLKQKALKKLRDALMGRDEHSWGGFGGLQPA